MDILLMYANKEGWPAPINAPINMSQNEEENDSSDSDWEDGLDEEPEENSELEDFEKNPDDETTEVFESTSKTSEDVHGGNEDTKSIEDSPNCTDNGKTKKNSSLKSGSGNEEREQPEQEKPTESQKSGAKKKEEVDKSLHLEEILSVAARKEEADDLVIFIRDLLKKHEGAETKGLSQKWDKKAIVRDLAAGAYSKVLEDREELTETREILLFLDLSGSFEGIRPTIQEVIRVLSSTGCAVTLMDCGNGFKETSLRRGDHANDYFSTEARLDKICKGTRAKLHPAFTSPSVEDAVKLVNQAEFSLIFADYDGFSSISMVGWAAESEKVPYFFDFDDRYEYPEEHDWVDSEWSTYPSEKWIKDFKYYM